MSSAERVAPQSQLNRGAELYTLIRAEYREMPGLKLTISQAARLWAADPKSCARALNALVEIGFLSLRRRHVPAGRLRAALRLTASATATA